MPAAHACVLLLAALASTVSARALPKPGLSAAPPHVLNIVRVRVKARSAGTYAGLEALIVRAYDRAKVPLFWLCLQSPRDPNDIVYLNLYDSAEAAGRAASIDQSAVSQHPDLLSLQDRLRALTASDASMLTTRRDDVDQSLANGIDFGNMRWLRMTSVLVRSGREGDFLDGIRTAHPRGRSWMVYESNETSAYALVTLKRTAFSRADGPPLPRPLPRHRDAIEKAETRVYRLRPDLSRVPASFFR